MCLMKPSVPERVQWAVDVLRVQPGDRLLEIGAGPGVAAALVAEQLVDGRLVAIDRSAVAVRRALDRNGAHVAAGKVEVRHASLEDFDGSGGPFDKIFAINVNVFWVGDAAAHVEQLAACLAPGGALYLFYEAPSTSKGREISDRVHNTLRAAGFAASTKKGTAAFAVIGKLSGSGCLGSSAWPS
jgi:cyclopropane fatty-acyl-phospholipid synthase-like methyltransferase